MNTGGWQYIWPVPVALPSMRRGVRHLAHEHLAVTHNYVTILPNHHLCIVKYFLYAYFVIANSTNEDTSKFKE